MDRPPRGQPLLGSVTFAGTYHAPGDPESSTYSYGRYHNPTWSRFENALGELEGGFALSFSSGMAAITAVLSITLHSGDVIGIPSDSYYTTRLFVEGFVAQLGVAVRQAPTASNAQMVDIRGMRLLWLETPSNPGLDVCDIATFTEAAHKEGALVAIDNTTATLLAQQPLELGADFSIGSDTKALTGHGDLILGHVAVRDSTWKDKLHAWRNLTGAVPGPMETWLAYRSLGTLEMRLNRQSANAQRVAEFLATRDDVTRVRYPGMDGDPAHKVAARQMKFFGPVIAFTLPNRDYAEAFLSACRLVIEATSFGGIHTTAERRARWGADKIPEGFIRLSVGCEDCQDIIDDLAQALNSASGNRVTK
jgi:cystathionine gamma-lyase